MNRWTGELSVGYWRVRRYLNDHRVVNTPRYDALRNQFYNELWQDTAAAMGATIEDIGYGYKRIAIGDKYTFVQGGKVQLDDHLILKIAGNKPLVYSMLTDRGYPVQPFLEYKLQSLDKAWKFIQESQTPCVVKPAAGSGAGNGITTKIRTMDQLKRASLWAGTFSRQLLIEREIAGESFRLLYLDGKLIDAVRRNPPHVTGDGKSDIRTLMLRENESRLSGKPITALCPLIVDFESELHLGSIGKKLGDVLPKGESVSVKTVSNQNRSSENETVRDIIHPSIVKTGAEISRIFKLKLSGVDVLTPDITKPLAEVGGVLGEVNTNPGLHHHYLISEPDKVAHVAQQIIAYILSQS